MGLAFTAIRISNCRVFVSLGALLMTGPLALAAPSITSISSSNLSHGQSVTVYGSGFGTKSTVKPYLWAPFEAASINPSSLGIVTSWSGVQSMGYHASEGIGGSGCAKSTDSLGMWTLSVSSSGFAWNDYGQEIYIFRKTKRNFETPDSLNWKVWRMWPSTVGTLPDIYVQSGNGCAYTEGIMPSCSWFNGSAFRGVTGSFNTEEIIFKGNTTSGVADGILRLVENGIQAANFSNMQTKNGAAAMTLNFPVHGVKANATMPSGATYWADDVYVDTTWARVLIGDQPTLAASTHREIQIPQTSWSDGQLQIQVNQGTFAQGAAAYVFVIDSSGTVSAGKPITFGDGTVYLSPSEPKNLNAR